MFKNYLKVIVRNLLKHKGYSIINLSGLIVGFVACVLILLYIQDELSFDKFHPKSHRTYRVTTEEVKDGGFRHLAYNYAPAAPALLNDFPEIEQAVRIFPKSVVVQLDPQRRFQEEDFIFADSTFFDIFSFVFKAGNAATALNSPYDIILTEKAAQKYFGDENPIGKTLTVESSYDFVVTGVLENIPANSHLYFEFVAAMGSIRDIQGWALRSWFHPPMYIYVVLPEGLAPGNIEARLPDFVAKNISGRASSERKMHLQAMTNIHLYSNLEGEISVCSDIAYVYIFASIAFFILLIACINFMNLATARSTTRAREVGLRKVVGARRWQLVNQFYSESLFFAGLALVVAITLVYFLLPAFNQLVDKRLSLNVLNNWQIALGFISLTITVGLLAGSYPAVLLSSFQPVKILQGNAASSGTTGLARLRSILVIVQFSISICLIIGSNVIKDQLSYIKNKKLGFDKEQIIVIPLQDESLQKNWESTKNLLFNDPAILSVTATSTIPGIDRDIDFLMTVEGKQDKWNVQTMLVDYDFIKTFGMQILAGRDFSKKFTADSADAYILNETAVNDLGWDSALEKKIELTVHGTPKKGRVIGVVKDFHFRSLHHKIVPLVLQISPRYYFRDEIAVKINSQDIAGTLATIQKRWHQIVPLRPFDYNFLDSVFEQIYIKEEKLSRIFSYFSGIAIFVGCLGLFGLVSFMTEQRTKEIGVRKVLGASVTNIVLMISKEFTALVVIAFVVASPIAYFAMNSWLQDFSYHTGMSQLTFLLSGLTVFVIASLTIVYQVFKAAVANPVEALRHQ